MAKGSTPRGHSRTHFCPTGALFDCTHTSPRNPTLGGNCPKAPVQRACSFDANVVVNCPPPLCMHHIIIHFFSLRFGMWTNAIICCPPLGLAHNSLANKHSTNTGGVPASQRSSTLRQINSLSEYRSVKKPARKPRWDLQTVLTTY